MDRALIDAAIMAAHRRGMLRATAFVGTLMLAQTVGFLVILHSLGAF